MSNIPNNTVRIDLSMTGEETFDIDFGWEFSEESPPEAAMTMIVLAYAFLACVDFDRERFQDIGLQYMVENNVGTSNDLTQETPTEGTA